MRVPNTSMAKPLPPSITVPGSIVRVALGETTTSLSRVIFPDQVVSEFIVDPSTWVRGENNVITNNATVKLVTNHCRRILSPLLRFHIKQMVGPPRFELGSDGPQPPSIGQANPRARESNLLTRCAEWCDFLNQVQVSNVHSSATISRETNLV